jgi:hypothetical protein
MRMHLRAAAAMCWIHGETTVPQPCQASSTIASPPTYPLQRNMQRRQLPKLHLLCGQQIPPQPWLLRWAGGLTEQHVLVSFSRQRCVLLHACVHACAHQQPDNAGFSKAEASPCFLQVTLTHAVALPCPVTTCPPGTRKDEITRTCAPCPANCAGCSSNTVCRKCSAGFWKKADGQCGQLQVGCVTTHSSRRHTLFGVWISRVRTPGRLSTACGAVLCGRKACANPPPTAALLFPRAIRWCCQHLHSEKNKLSLHLPRWHLQEPPDLGPQSPVSGLHIALPYLVRRLPHHTRSVFCWSCCGEMHCRPIAGGGGR